jgi:hypothetical protein
MSDDMIGLTCLGLVFLASLIGFALIMINRPDEPIPPRIPTRLYPSPLPCDDTAEVCTGDCGDCPSSLRDQGLRLGDGNRVVTKAHERAWDGR